MKVTVPKSFKANPANVLRQAGYHPIVDTKSTPGEGKDSWVRQLGNSRYPRFHLYLKESSAGFVFDLHIDQKQSTINLPGTKRHAGEYDTPVVGTELERIKRWLAYAHTN